MSPPDLPGIPSRNLPPRKDPRRDSPGPFEAVIPAPAPAPREATQAVAKPSIFDRLAPDRWARNVVWILLSLGVGGGSAVALNRGQSAAPIDCASKAEFVQLRDAFRQRSWRAEDFEDMVATAFSHPPCYTKQIEGKPQMVCGPVKLRGFKAQNATFKSEGLDPPVFLVELDDRDPIQRPRNSP